MVAEGQRSSPLPAAGGSHRCVEGALGARPLRLESAEGLLGDIEHNVCVRKQQPRAAVTT